MRAVRVRRKLMKSTLYATGLTVIPSKKKSKTKTPFWFPKNRQLHLSNSMDSNHLACEMMAVSYDLSFSQCKGLWLGRDSRIGAHCSHMLWRKRSLKTSVLPHSGAHPSKPSSSPGQRKPCKLTPQITPSHTSQKVSWAKVCKTNPCPHRFCFLDLFDLRLVIKSVRVRLCSRSSNEESDLTCREKMATLNSCTIVHTHTRTHPCDIYFTRTKHTHTHVHTPTFPLLVSSKKV